MVEPARRAERGVSLVVGVLFIGMAARLAHAEEAKPLGRLEQESVDEALAASGLRVDPHPEGKVVGGVLAWLVNTGVSAVIGLVVGVIAVALIKLLSLARRGRSSP